MIGDMKLFRGVSAQVWRQRFEQAGWPREAADRIAMWLTAGVNEPPPGWAEILDKAKDKSR